MGLRSSAVAWAKKGVKLALLGPATVARPREPGLLVLIYHRVGASSGLELDLPEAAFRAQMRHLRDRASSGALELVDLGVGISRVREGRRPERDLVAVTFDDGYRDVATRAWPVLRDLGIPATVFLATGFLEGEVAAPLSRAPDPGAEAAEPMTWDQVGEMAGSGMVSVGSHTHTHRDLDGLSAAEAEDDLERASEVLSRRLGPGPGGPDGFAYPRAVVAHASVVERHHRWAVGGDAGKNLARSLRPLALSRAPVRASDGLFFFRRRVAGIAPLEDRLYARLKGARR